MNVAKRVAETLRDLGVKYVFGNPSGSFGDFMEGLRQTDGIEFILVTNEASGGFMADVCWRLTGQMAVTFGTFGPGACNQTTGVVGGLLDRSPMLAFADEFDSDMLSRTVQMNIDQEAMFKPITKMQTRIAPNIVREVLYQAFRIASEERPGPVYVGLPCGMGVRESGEEEIPLPVINEVRPASDASIRSMQESFQGSRRPVVALGISAVRWNLSEPVIAFAEKFNIPIVLTPMAKGMVPEDHASYTGVLAHALADQVGKTHQEADLIIGIGFDPIEINYEEWIPEVEVVHLDTCAADLDTTRYTLAADVVGNLADSLQKLRETDCEPKEWDLSIVAKRTEKIFSQLKEVEGLFDPRCVLAGLREKMPEDGIMTCDVGAHLHLIGQTWKTPSPECQLMTNGCSSMGFGIPAAIAAKMCFPERAVACVVGDGGFLMMCGEMATAMRLNRNIVFVLLTDKQLSLIGIKQENKSYPIYGTPLYGDEYVSSNNYFGVPVLPARNREEYSAALDEAFASSGPVIVEAFVKREDYQGLILRGNRS